MKRFLIGLSIVGSLVLGLGAISAAAPFPAALGGRGTSTLPFKGGIDVGVNTTTFGSAPSGTDGFYLVASSSNAFGIIWQQSWSQFAIQNCSAGQLVNSISPTGTINCIARTATTTIGGANGPTFNFRIATTSGNPSITTSTDAASSTVLFTVPSGSSAAGTATGTAGDVQYNDGGSFGADAGNFAYGSTTKRLTLNISSSSAIIGTNFLGTASSATFSYSGATTSWNIPVGVTQITVTAYGGAGGAWNSGTVTSTGGSMAGVLNVTAGQTYFLLVGARGATPSSSAIITASAFGGGGVDASNTNTQAGGGGGMSWFSSSSTFNASSSNILIAGGGGGSANSGAGGSGGGTTGGAGGSVAGSTGGGGGTQSAGGALGAGANSAPNGTAGSSGQGGNGVGGGNINGGGGGGGGLYGGGGGGANNAANGSSGGGGGSSFASASFSSQVNTQGGAANRLDGQIVVTYNIVATPASGYTLAIGGYVLTGGLAPTISGSTVSGNDTSGLITYANANTAITLTFSATSANPRQCWVSTASGTIHYFKAQGSTTSTIITADSLVATSSVAQYLCVTN